MFKAIADPTRREILSLLRDSRLSVGELAANFHVSRPAISKHLRILRDAGLVTDRADGTARICELNAVPLADIDTWLHDYRTFWNGNLRRLKRFVEENP